MKEVFSVLSLVIFLFSSIALGQTSGSISGTVKDATGAVVASADVSILNAQQLILHSSGQM